MKLYIVIQPAGYADPEEIRGVFSSEALAEAARKNGERIDPIELDAVYPDGTNAEWIEFKNKRVPLTPNMKAAYETLLKKSPYLDLLK